MSGQFRVWLNLQQANELRASPSSNAASSLPAMQCKASAARWWRQISFSLLLLHKALLHSETACTLLAIYAALLLGPACHLIFDGSFKNCGSVFRDTVINGSPCFMQVSYPFPFVSSGIHGIWFPQWGLFCILWKHINVCEHCDSVIFFSASPSLPWHVTSWGT